MAGARKQDLIGRLADLSEEAIQRLSEAPGADRLLHTLNSVRDRLDELQRRVRGLEELERRLAALEKKVDRLSKASSAPARRSTRGGTGRSGSRSSSAPKSS
jgi:hypothetical protein